MLLARTVKSHNLLPVYRTVRLRVNVQFNYIGEIGIGYTYWIVLPYLL